MRPSATPIETLLKGLAHDIEREAIYPSRPELRQRLERIKAAARPGRRPGARELLKHELADPRIAGLLGIDGPDLPKDIRNRAVQVLTRAARHGRGRLYPDKAAGPDALEHCALIATMIWHRSTGELPRQGCSRVHQLCELLWRTAGGDRHGGLAARSGALTAWRRHLITARDRYLPPHPAGRLVSRILDPPPERPRRLHAELNPIRPARRRLLAMIKRQYGLFEP
jgi:hypothetical protein